MATLSVPSFNNYSHNASVVSRVSVFAAEKRPTGHFCGSNYYNICLDLFIALLTATEIGLVLYLSITHFMHSQQDLEGMAMLLPILLNFVGVIYFLSNPFERFLFETIGCSRCCTDVLQIPIFGPVLTAFQIFLISCGWSEVEGYARLEASAAKMRQATTFFSAAPEAAVQLTVLFMNETSGMNLDKVLEISIVVVAVVAIAEANTFSLVSNYFRLFHSYEEHEWSVSHGLKFTAKTLLFVHALSSVGARLIAAAQLTVALFCYFDINFTFAFVVMLFLELAYRIVIYYAARLVKHLATAQEVPSGCYESINFAWRETILSFGFQSRNGWVQLFFYAENFAFFTFWLSSVGQEELEDTRERIYLPSSLAFAALSVVSLLSLATIHCHRLATIRWTLQ